MKVLMLSSDQLILRENSSARARMREYARLCDELHIVVLSDSGTTVQQEGNLFLHPTNSLFALQRFLDAFSVCRRVVREYGLGAGDIVTAQDPFEIGLIGMWVQRVWGLKLHIQIHTDFSNEYFIKQSFKNVVRVGIAALVLPHARGIRVVSERIARALRGRAARVSIRVLPVFVDVAAIQASPITVDLHKKYPDFSKILLMVSRLTAEKQVLVVRDIMKELHEQFPHAGLVIVGDGPERSWLSGYDFIKLEGWVDEPFSYMKTADVFVNASVYEGYGRTLIEAAACGTPIITTDVGVAQEVIEDGRTGRIILAADKQSIKAAIAAWLSGADQFERPSMQVATKQAYLDAYKEDWEACVRS